jgi:hypothetical protein
MRTAKRAGILVVAAVALLSAGPAEAQLAQTPAATWMQLDRSTRTAYVLGFLSGVQHVLQCTGMDLRLRAGVDADELSIAVYTKLLAEPELRWSPIGLIIMDALRDYISFTDPYGNPID